MTESLHISNSEIQTFKRCRRKWWFGYYRRLKPLHERKVGPLRIGNRVHESLESYYLALAGVDTADAVKVALAKHDMLVMVDLETADESDEKTIKEITSQGDLSRAMLEGYFEWLAETGADQGYRVVGIEQTVSTEITTPLGAQFHTKAKLDLVVEDEDAGERWFLDHKTVGDFTTPTRMLHLDEQMLMYNWLQSLTVPGKTEGAIYNMIKKSKRTQRAKPPFFMRFKVRHSQQELDSFYVRLLGELDQIARVRQLLDEGQDPRRVAYPSPKSECSWDCQYLYICPLIDRTQDDAEHAISLTFREGDPYEYYGEEKKSG